MFCCCGAPRVVEDNKPLIVDLNEVLCKRVWRSYRATWGLCDRISLKREHFEFEVPENFFVFEELSQEIIPRKEVEIRPPDAQSSPSKKKSGNNIKDVATQGNSGLLKGKIPSVRDLTNPEIISLDTEFSNDTAERQLYKFRFEKTRKTDIEVTFQKGFTLGGKANFNIGIPLGVETEAQYQVTKTHGQRFEETMLMEATSDIAVGPHSCYTANVQLEERPLHANFKIITRMSMPQGRAPVYIKRKGDGEKVFVYYVKNLPDMFGEDEVPCAKKIEGCFDEIDFVIEGVIKGVLACNHRILLTSNESEEIKTQAKARYLKSLEEGSGVHERGGGDR